MTAKEQYRLLCNNKKLSIPLYVSAWWLDCVCGAETWEVLLYVGKNNEIEAAMPLYMPENKVIMMPPFTQTMGIWFHPALENKKYASLLYHKQMICEYFIRQLPKHRYFQQNFHHSFSDWLPFYWKGFRQTTRYTYLIPDLSNQERLEDNLCENIRRNIHKAQCKYALTVRPRVPSDVFMALYRQTYQRQGKKVYYPAVLEQIIEMATDSRKGNIWGAYDANGRLHAAVFIVWHNACAYYIAGGSDPDLRKSGGHALALRTAICDVSQFAQTFDFEGSMAQNIEHFFREFGGIQTPYHAISQGKLTLIDKFFIHLK